MPNWDPAIPVDQAQQTFEPLGYLVRRSTPYGK